MTQTETLTIAAAIIAAAHPDWPYEHSTELAMKLWNDAEFLVGHESLERLTQRRQEREAT